MIDSEWSIVEHSNKTYKHKINIDQVRSLKRRVLSKQVRNKNNVYSDVTQESWRRKFSSLVSNRYHFPSSELRDSHKPEIKISSACTYKYKYLTRLPSETRLLINNLASFYDKVLPSSKSISNKLDIIDGTG